MFLCENCHYADKSCLAILIPFRSYGLCEHCGHKGSCVDCRNLACQIKPKEHNASKVN